MDFFQKYFIDPIINLSGYNIVNTTVYIVLYILAFYILYHYFLKRKKIYLDDYFFYNLMLSTYIILTIRVCIDIMLCERNIFFYTPLLQFWIFLLFFPNLLFFEKRKYFFYFYILLSVVFTFVFLRKIPNLFILLPILSIITMIYFIRKKKYHVMPVISQVLDGISGTIGIFYGFSPEHVVHRSILNTFGTLEGSIIFLTMKFFILLVFIFIVMKYIEDEDLKNTLYLAVFYVGYLTGLRSSLIISYYEI